VSGQIDLFQIVVIIFSIVVISTDLIHGKIYNWLTFPGIITGIIYSIWTGNLEGLALSLAAIVIAFLIYGSLLFLRVLGAGDVKLLMALGAWGGVEYTLKVSFLGIMLGGVFAFIILLYKRKLMNFFYKMYYFFATLVIRDLEVIFPKADEKLKMPFGLAISAAACWVAFGTPFRSLGLIWLS